METMRVKGEQLVGSGFRVSQLDVEKQQFFKLSNTHNQMMTENSETSKHER
jgi:hypothetical protein